MLLWKEAGFQSVLPGEIK